MYKFVIWFYSFTSLRAYEAPFVKNLITHTNMFFSNIKVNFFNFQEVHMKITASKQTRH
jgi:hypothetical protein